MTFHANLQVSSLHYTVRKKEDSDWLAQNIDKVVADQKRKTNSQEVIKYKQIQTSSLHRRLNSSEWDSGNKDKNADARAALNFSATSTLFPGDLDKVKGLISSRVRSPNIPVLLGRRVGFRSTFSIYVGRSIFLAGLTAYGRFPDNQACQTCNQSACQVAAAQGQLELRSGRQSYSFAMSGQCIAGVRSFGG